MYAQVIHRLIDAVRDLHPNDRAELHEMVGEETAAALNADQAKPDTPPVAAVTPDTPPEPEPPAAAVAALHPGNTA